MILSNREIKKYLKKKKIIINPRVKEADIRPGGIRIHLGNEILIPVENKTINLNKKENVSSLYKKKSIGENGYLLEPGAFILGTSREQIRLSKNLIGFLDGRSTLARTGLAIHCTAGIIDGMWESPRIIILELCNQGKFNLLLYPDMAIGMILFFKMSGTITPKNQLQYRDQQHILPPDFLNQNTGL